MSYTMRFIQTDDLPVTLESLHEAVCDDDPDCSVASDGALTKLGERYGIIRLIENGDGRFETELRSLRAAVQNVEGNGKRKVERTLDQARSIVAVEVLWGEREPEQTLRTIDPLWRWLFANRSGLVQADNEGYYELKRRILAVE